VVTPAKITKFCGELRNVLHGPNRAHAKQVLRAIGTKVQVTNDTIKISADEASLLALVSSEDAADGEGGNGVPGVRRYVRR
jgi:hypothetical protein